MRQWTIDAFTHRPFGGNQAAVVEPLADWPAESWMQALAAENSVGATAFLLRTRDPGRFGLRWFTPATEVPLCGHATLAAAHMLVQELGAGDDRLTFETQAGDLTVVHADEAWEMSLPAFAGRPIPTPAGLAGALGAEPVQVWLGNYLVALLDSVETVRSLSPDHARLEAISHPLGGLGNVGVAALAGPGERADVVDRFFAPGFGIPEDPATGSFHALLMPILAERLAVERLTFHQAYPGRGADLAARMAGDRVILRGGAVTTGETVLRLAGGGAPSPLPAPAALANW